MVRWYRAELERLHRSFANYMRSDEQKVLQFRHLYNTNMPTPPLQPPPGTVTGEEEYRRNLAWIQSHLRRTYNITNIALHLPSGANLSRESREGLRRFYLAHRDAIMRHNDPHGLWPPWTTTQDFESLEHSYRASHTDGSPIRPTMINYESANYHVMLSLIRNHPAATGEARVAQSIPETGRHLGIDYKRHNETRMTPDRTLTSHATRCLPSVSTSTAHPITIQTTSLPRGGDGHTEGELQAQRPNHEQVVSHIAYIREEAQSRRVDPLP
jgi:hypothetical protein